MEKPKNKSTGTKKRYPRLFGPWKYKKFSWYEEAEDARTRHKQLSNEFNVVGDERKLVINKELEVIDDYFDWLQILL
jgi:hypothetical protein